MPGQLVGGLRAKLPTRLAEGAITPAADRQLNSELTTLLGRDRVGRAWPEDGTTRYPLHQEDSRYGRG